MSRSSDKKGFVYTLDVFIAVSIIVAGSWIIMFNLFSQTDTLRPRIISEDLIAESYGKRVAELNYPIIQAMTRDGNITDNTNTFAEQIGEFYWLSIKRDDAIYLQRAREMIDEYYRGIIPSQYQFMIRIGDFNDPIERTDAVYFRTDSVSAGGELTGNPRGHTCAIREDGVLVCWGLNNFGQLGIGNTDNQHEATPVNTSLRFRMVSAGNEHTCGIDINNTLYCWGRNDHGRLGIGSNGGQRNIPTLVDYDFIRVDAGGEHTCGIKSDRTLYCWGNAGLGRLGNGETNGAYNVPQQIDNSSIYQTVAAGVTHTCGIKMGGEAYCWGANNRGQLGNGGTDPSSTPVRAGSMRFLEVDVGDEFSCGIESSIQRRILCWGSNHNRKSGQSSGTTITSPRPVEPSIPAITNEDFPIISLGQNHGCAIGSESSVYCWGANNHRQLGVSLGGGQLLVLSDAEPYHKIASGSSHTCGIVAKNNTIKCWGQTFAGQAGQPQGGPQTNPLEIIPSHYTYLSNELRVLHSRNNTPMNNSQLILPSRTIIAGIDRDNQFYGPFVFEVVVWL